MRTNLPFLIRASSAGLACCAVLLAGCGATPAPCVTGTAVSLLSTGGTADHKAAAPGNQFQFFAEGGVYVVSGSGCAIPQVIGPVAMDWSTSDPQDVAIDSTPGPTNGVATCLNATTEPVTITATPPVGTKYYKPASLTGTLVCK